MESSNTVVEDNVIDDNSINTPSELLKRFNFGCSYSCQKIIDWLNEKGIEYVCSSSMKRIRETGVRIQLNKYIYLSIQTEPDVAGSQFAETALLRKEDGCVYSDDLGYSDVLRHDEPDDLFDHITELLEKFKTLDPEFGADLHSSRYQKR